MIEFKLDIDRSNLIGCKRSRVFIGDASGAIARTPIARRVGRVRIGNVSIKRKRQVGGAADAQGIDGVERRFEHGTDVHRPRRRIRTRAVGHPVFNGQESDRSTGNIEQTRFREAIRTGC